MYVAVMDNQSIYRVFFVTFYYFSVIIGVNLFVAFVLDMYSSVERLDKERAETLKLLEAEISKNIEEENTEDKIVMIEQL